MPEEPKCSFWNFTELAELNDAEGENCDKPAFMYRFHGEPGNLNRLVLYCGKHTYRNSACHLITPEILKRARDEGWPFMEWPPPKPPTPEQVTAEKIAAWVEDLPVKYVREVARAIRRQFGNEAPA